jgi:hypothetical protein
MTCSCSIGHNDSNNSVSEDERCPFAFAFAFTGSVRDRLLNSSTASVAECLQKQLAMVVFFTSVKGCVLVLAFPPSRDVAKLRIVILQDEIKIYYEYMINLASTRHSADQNRVAENHNMVTASTILSEVHSSRDVHIESYYIIKSH